MIGVKQITFVKSKCFQGITAFLMDKNYNRNTSVCSLNISELIHVEIKVTFFELEKLCGFFYTTWKIDLPISAQNQGIELASRFEMNERRNTKMKQKFL